MRKKALLFIAGLAMALIVSTAANAVVVDLATPLDANTPVNTGLNDVGGALFQWTPTQPTGTGFIDSFVQLQSPGNETTEEGYNTTVNNTFDNGSSDNFNHALLLTDIPIVPIGGVDYRQFLLDVNEPQGQEGDEFISLNDVQILQSNVANPSDTTFAGDGVFLNSTPHTFVYRLDDGVDNTIELNAALNSGSGSGDMFMYVRDDLFDPNTTYVYLYSIFGNPNGAQGGFEEWAVLDRGGENIIPEPATVSLLGLGLVGMMVKKMRKRAA